MGEVGRFNRERLEAFLLQQRDRGEFEDEITPYLITEHVPDMHSREVKTKTREVAHILVSSKSLADQIETKLKNGESFAKLAKKYSKDTGSAQQGGKLCVAHGGSSGACSRRKSSTSRCGFTGTG